MRVTNNITTGQFLRNNNMALTTMLKSHNRIMTQRRFNRVSEDSINGSKAMTIRRQLRDLDIYKDNLSSAKELFSAAETNLYSVAHDIYIKVEEKLVAAANGTYEQMDLDIFAVEFDELADHMVKNLNADFAERQLFGGTSNDPTPFEINQVKITDADGKVVFPPEYEQYVNPDGTIADGYPKNVTYNGVPLDFDVTSDIILPDGTISKLAAGEYTVSHYNSKKGTWEDQPKIDVTEAINQKDNSLIYPGSKPIYIDIGLGIKYNDKYEVDPQTALDISMNGAAITGNGIDISKVDTKAKMNIVTDPGGTTTETPALDADGNPIYEVERNDDGTMKLDDRFSKNLIQLVLDAAKALRNGDQDTVNAIIDRAKDANNHILTEITTLGTKQNSIEFYLNKTEDYKFNLRERQNLVEGTDMEAEITNYEAVKAAYDATLKIGAQLLPHSIFDFI